MKPQNVMRDEKIALFRLLFRGREDIFARRWQKSEKSGYAPAYSFSWEEFNAHRANGETLRDFENKKPIPLDDSASAITFPQ